MHKLNFPEYQFHITEESGKSSIFDPVRKKYVALTPEEWVRQHFIQFLIIEKKVPESLIRAEAEIKLYRTRKRFDIAIFNRNGKALLIVECKAPSVAITQDVLDQVIRYNLAMQVRYLVLTNGLTHLYCHSDPVSGKTKLIDDLPSYDQLT